MRLTLWLFGQEVFSIDLGPSPAAEETTEWSVVSESQIAEPYVEPTGYELDRVGFGKA
jgi:hypothetical protein